MDEKTEELRDIFVDVAGDSTVTERQTEARGSLTDEDDGAVADRLRVVIDRMAERFSFDSELDREALYEVLTRFYNGEGDGSIAETLDVTRHQVFLARTDLHLLREADTDAPFDLEELRELMTAGRTVSEAAQALDVAESTVRRYRRVLETRAESRQVSERFRDEFEELLTDADLEGRMTEDVQETGLEDATDGMETNVSF